ncbi:TIP41-like protein, partial [Zopfochytrium polystomum]
RIPIPPPDMFFGENSLTLSHDASAVSIVFNAEDALECVGRKQDELEGLVKVAHAETWNRSKGDIDKMAKPYDWTFSTDYKGSVGISAPFDDTSVGIDMDVLKRQDEILFYEEMSLYEDELADNGASVLNLRIRVMPTFFFVLMRLFVRVDGVLFRVRDTRLFHQFEESFVIRDYREMEQDYASVKSVSDEENALPW